MFSKKDNGTECKLKYFVDVRGHGVYHISADDAREVYKLCEQIEDLPEGELVSAFEEGKEVELPKSNAQRVWGEEMSDRELMIQTMKGNIFKKAAMTVNLPKARKEKVKGKG